MWGVWSGQMCVVANLVNCCPLRYTLVNRCRMCLSCVAVRKRALLEPHPNISRLVSIRLVLSGQEEKAVKVLKSSGNGALLG